MVRPLFMVFCLLFSLAAPAGAQPLPLKVALAQLNPLVGDFIGNAQQIARAYEDAAMLGADLVVTPEFMLPGYPAYDLLDRSADCFTRVEEGLAIIKEATRRVSRLLGYDVPVIVGHVARTPYDGAKDKQNVASVILNGEIVFTQSKVLLPTYDIFDEARYFAPAREQRVWEFKGVKIAIAICEDWWFEDVDAEGRHLYDFNTIQNFKDQGAQLAISLSASPYNRDKQVVRERLHGEAARLLGAPLIWANQWGATDGVLFDGRSFIVDETGFVRGRLKAFAPDAAIVDFTGNVIEVTHVSTVRTEAYAPEANFKPRLPAPLQAVMDRLQTSVSIGNNEDDVVIMAIIMGIREYARKTGHRRAILGLSGGADSAANAAVVALALGPENLLTLGMKTEFTRVGSVTDANVMARNFGFTYEDGSIQEEFEAYVRNNPMPARLQRILDDPASPADEVARIDARRRTQLENAQARIRMTRLFGRANLEGGMILMATSNKNELGNGYFTLHGDYAGGLSPLGDQGKPEVWRYMARINELAGTELIPAAIITKPPSHELSAGVVTTDDIPPYPVLHRLYHGYMVDGRSVEDLTREFGPLFANMPAPQPKWAGPDWVQRAIQLFERNDHKRRQEIQILRTTRKAFGYGRRVPIAKRWEVGRPVVAVSCAGALEP